MKRQSVKKYHDLNDVYVVFFVLLVVVVGILVLARPIPKRTILKECTDERGYHSVIFIESGDTVGLDFLTDEEYAKLFQP